MKTWFCIIALIASANALASARIDSENSLKKAISAANNNPQITQIIFSDNSSIKLTHPIIYNGEQALTLIGNKSTIDGSAISEEGALIFNTTADISLQNLSIKNSGAKGVLINMPANTQQRDIQINLHKVNIINSALHGLHVNDNSDEKSTSGINLIITHSNFFKNGTKASDFDGIRVDERKSGNITVLIKHSHFDHNGGDGIELDERGPGNVIATIEQTTMNNNGYFTKDDPEDGLDVDETGSGNIKISLTHVQAKKNKAEGLDFDESGTGDVELYLNRVKVSKNKTKGIKASEQNAGNLFAKLSKVKVIKNDSDGIQFTETDSGKITLFLNKVTSHKNKKQGIKVEQWFNKNEKDRQEDSGSILTRELSLKKNGKGGNKIKTHNVVIDTYYSMFQF